MPVIQNTAQVGETIRFRNYELTPVSQAFKIQFPGHPAGFVWNRPKAVIVKAEDGQERVLPVVDMTRVTIWAMLAGGLIGAIVMGMSSRQRKSQ